MLTLLLLIGLPSADVTLYRLDGQTVEGELVAWTTEVVTVGDAETPVADVARVLFGRETPPLAETAFVVSLAEGTQIAATDFTRTGDAATVGFAGQSLEVPADALRSVRFRAAAAATLAQWQTIVEAAGEEDLFVVLRGGEPDRVACVLGDVTAESVSLRARGRDLTVPRERVFGLVFRGASATPAPAFVTLTGGSRLGINAARLEADALILQRDGRELTVGLDAVAGVDLAAGRVQPLTDLEPSRVAYDGFGENYDERAWKLRVGRNAVNEKLRLQGRTYEDGVWMHSGTTASYPLPADAARFQATVGIDELETVGRPVRLVILADGRELFSERIEPGSTSAIDIDVSGRRELTLRAETTDRGGLGIREHLAVVAGRLILE